MVSVPGSVRSDGKLGVMASQERWKVKSGRSRVAGQKGWVSQECWQVRKDCKSKVMTSQDWQVNSGRSRVAGRSGVMASQE